MTALLDGYSVFCSLVVAGYEVKGSNNNLHEFELGLKEIHFCNCFNYLNNKLDNYFFMTLLPHL